MFNLNHSKKFPLIDNNELSFSSYSNDVNYFPELSNQLSSIDFCNALTDNINFDINPNNLDNEEYDAIENYHNPNLENDNIIEGNVNLVIEINNSKMNSNKQNALGRKRKGSESIGKHNECSEDNMIRKYKIYLIETLRNKINSELKKEPVSIEIKGKKYKADRLLKIDQKFAKNIAVNEMRNFLTNKLKTNFSVDISELYKKYPKNYNKEVIEKLFEENKTNMTSILDKNTLECIKYFRKDEDAFSNEENSCLKGIEIRFETLPQILKNNKFNDEYIKNFIGLIKDLENIIERKSPRKARKKSSDNN